MIRHSDTATPLRSRLEPRFSSIIIPTLLAMGTAALYLPRLQDAPLYLNRDELFSALAAHSVASTGRDPSGLFMPLFFQIHVANLHPMWFQPVLMYAITLAVKVLPFSEGTIRLPMAIAGVIDVVLMYFVGRLLFERALFAIAAAVLLALTPAHFMYSRFAMDFQMPLPFVLGWLICLLTYLRSNDARALFAAGLLLGIGLYTYIASFMMMPIYWLLTCVALYRRHDPPNRFWILTAGFIAPALLCVPFLLHHPAAVREVALHYQRHEPQSRSALGLIGALVSPTRIVEMIAPFWTFWNPRFLFINGPSWVSESTWQIGVFLLPIAGLLVVGAARAVRHPNNPKTILLIGGLLSAPVAGSFVGEPEAIRRALELLPFGVLLAVFGLEYLWAAKTNRERQIAFLALWVVGLALAVASHDYVPRAQAYVRALTVPLAVAGLTVLLERCAIDRLTLRRSGVVAIVSLLAMQVAYFFNCAYIVTAALVGVLTLGMLLEARAAHRGWNLAIVPVIAALSSEFMHFYVDYSARRVAFIPASAIVLAVRLILTSAVLAASIGLVASARRAVARLGDLRAVAAALFTVAFVQFTYFYIDWFVDPRVRSIHVTVVVLSIVAAAVLMKDAAADRLRRLGPLTAVAVLGLVCVQFAYFYVDYFRGFQARRSSEFEGNVRLALETAIDRARDRPVPAIYVERVRAELGGGELTGLGSLYAKFYLMKGKREDLITRIIEGEDYGAFEPDRIGRLPSGSIVIANPSGPTNRFIEQMVEAGTLRMDAFLKAPDGTPIFWVLERIGR